MMNPEIKAQWVAALRSGKYDQCRGELRMGNGYCCLGVLQEITGIDEDESAALLEYEAAGEIGLLIDTQQALAEMNDDGKTFAEIADHIEETL